jgi:hypothetical protein
LQRLGHERAEADIEKSLGTLCERLKACRRYETAGANWEFRRLLSFHSRFKERIHRSAIRVIRSGNIRRTEKSCQGDASKSKWGFYLDGRLFDIKKELTRTKSTETWHGNSGPCSEKASVIGRRT